MTIMSTPASDRLVSSERLSQRSEEGMQRGAGELDFVMDGRADVLGPTA
ncbi:hypothetical protein [Sphingomonas sp. 28-62-20]